MDKRVLAKAVYDNVAETPSELAFRRGDVLTILNQSLDTLEGWWLCAFRGKQGLAPGNRLKLLAGAYSPTVLQLSPTSSFTENGSVESLRLSAASSGSASRESEFSSQHRPRSNHSLDGVISQKPGRADSAGKASSSTLHLSSVDHSGYDELPPPRAVTPVQKQESNNLNRLGRMRSPAENIISTSSETRSASPLISANGKVVIKSAMPTPPPTAACGTYDVPVPSIHLGAGNTSSLGRRAGKSGSSSTLPLAHQSPTHARTGGSGNSGMAVSHQRSWSNDSALLGNSSGREGITVISPGRGGRSTTPLISSAGTVTLVKPVLRYPGDGASFHSNRSSNQSFDSSSSSISESVASAPVMTGSLDLEAYDVPQPHYTQRLHQEDAKLSGPARPKLPQNITLASKMYGGHAHAGGTSGNTERPQSGGDNQPQLLDYDVPRSRRLPNSPLPPLPTECSIRSDSKSSSGSLTSSGSLAASLIEDVYDKPIPSRKYILSDGTGGSCCEVNSVVEGEASPPFPLLGDYDLLPSSQPIPVGSFNKGDSAKNGSLQPVSGDLQTIVLGLSNIGINTGLHGTPATTANASSNSLILERDSSSGLDDGVGSIMDRSTAWEYLGQAQTDIDTACSRLLRFVAPFWREKETLEPIVYDVKLSCLGFQSTLTEFVQFAAAACQPHSSPKVLSTSSVPGNVAAAQKQMDTALGPILAQQRAVDTSMRRLQAAKWSVTSLLHPVGSPPLRQVDDLGVIVSTAQHAPTLVGIALAVARSNSDLLFPAHEDTRMTNGTCADTFAANSTDTLTETPEGSITSDVTDSGPSKLNPDNDFSAVGPNDQQYLAFYQPHVDEIRDSVSGIASQLIECLRSLETDHSHSPGHRQHQSGNANDSTLSARTTATTQMFVGLSRDAVTRAHRLVFIGEALSQHVCHAGVQRSVVECANELCECLKRLIGQTKDVALGQEGKRVEAVTGLQREVEALRRVMGTFSKVLAAPLAGREMGQGVTNGSQIGVGLTA